MNGLWTQTVDEPTLTCIAEEISRRGYGVIKGYLSDEDLSSIRELAVRACAEAGHQYIEFTGPDSVRGTALGELPEYQPFHDLCRRLYELGTRQKPPPINFYQIFRCLKGETGLANSYIFHYDSYVLTVLLPIAIPTEGRRGDLLIFPNLRPIRGSYLRNLLDKFLVDNPISQKVFKREVLSENGRVHAIQMIPGDAYFFWGYCSLHANEPCDPDKLRATALLHYGDPHRGNKVRNWIRAARKVPIQP